MGARVLCEASGCMSVQNCFVEPLTPNVLVASLIYAHLWHLELGDNNNNKNGKIILVGLTLNGNALQQQQLLQL